LKRSSWFLLGLLTAVAPAQTVSVSSLLDEMPSLDWLTSRPQPFFRAAQASSYDRASTSPKDSKTWFANGDAGKFIRVEDKDGHKEYVMADLKGPGAVVRVWSANPMGTIRCYFDGESKPRLESKMGDLLLGLVAPFSDPIAYGCSQGANIYFPFPYAKSLKITVENEKPEIPPLYYHVGYRSYEPSTKVETFDPAKMPTAKVQSVSKKLMDGIQLSGVTRDSVKTVLKPGGRPFNRTIRAKSGGVLKMLRVRIPFPLVINIRAMDWDDPFQPHNVLRYSILRISCDGERTVEAPLGDFFATAPGPNEAKSLPIQVTKDGTLTCYWPMPFQKQIEVSITGPGKVEVPMTVDLAWGDRKFTPETYYFRAIYNTDIGNTRPMRDMEFLHASGEGMFVGTHLHVTNPTPAWWGEGDEKVYVDDESFPSTFGTGTEDYFGYAWCSPQLFTRPYHGQARCDGPGNFGQTSVRRFQTFDPIPFTKSLRFDMEMWHWAEVNARYARTTYWYSRPGSKVERKPILPNDLKLVETTPPAPVKGAIEGEKQKVQTTGGKVEMQEGFWELSGGKQIWWMDAKEGDKLTVTFPVANAGRYQLVGNFCHARDYGIHAIRLLDSNGREVLPAKTFDFYGTGVNWKKLPIGTANLAKGVYILEVVCKGRREAALPRQMFGLDYLILEPK
jgi:hypothetical protein